MATTRVRGHWRASGWVRAHTRRLPGKESGAGVIVFLLLVVLIAGAAFVHDTATQASGGKTWQRGDLTFTEVTSSDAMPCSGHAHGAVQQFFTDHPCARLQRVLLSARDDQGRNAIVAVSRVDMPTAAEATNLKELVDTNGTGNVDQLAREVPKYASVRFAGLHYDSKLDASTVVISEAEKAPGSGKTPWLKAAATAALDYPGM